MRHDEHLVSELRALLDRVAAQLALMTDDQIKHAMREPIRHTDYNELLDPSFMPEEMMMIPASSNIRRCESIERLTRLRKLLY